MKVKFLAVLGLLALLVVGCGWHPQVTEVGLSEPWVSLDLPVNNEISKVFVSTSTQFQAVHRGDAKVSAGYLDKLRAQGWEMENFRTASDPQALVVAELSKDSEKMAFRAYRFDSSSTAVALDLQE